MAALRQVNVLHSKTVQHKPGRGGGGGQSQSAGAQVGSERRRDRMLQVQVGACWLDRSWLGATVAAVAAP